MVARFIVTYNCFINDIVLHLQLYAGCHPPKVSHGAFQCLAVATLLSRLQLVL